MPTIHRQLRNWCRRRGYDRCEEFATRLDDFLAEELELSPETLLAGCRQVRTTRFFRENRLDREEVAQELAEYLEMPRVRARIVKVGPDDPDEPRDVGNPGGAPPDLFLSYYHVDRNFVSRLASDVAHAGFTVWYDAQALTAGSSFPSELERAVGSTRKIGVVCTARSLERPWVRKEIDVGHLREGRGEGEILVPIRLEQCELPPFLAIKQWCDFHSGYEDGLDELLASLP